MKRKIMKMIQESKKGWTGDIENETISIFDKMAEGYEDVEEDLDYIVQKLKEDNLEEFFNLQDVEKIIKQGQWNFGQWEEN